MPTEATSYLTALLPCHRNDRRVAVIVWAWSLRARTSTRKRRSAIVARKRSFSTARRKAHSETSFLVMKRNTRRRLSVCAVNSDPHQHSVASLGNRRSVTLVRYRSHDGNIRERYSRRPIDSPSLGHAKKASCGMRGTSRRSNTLPTRHRSATLKWPRRRRSPSGFTASRNK
jgi:hypothetical protein